MRLNWASPSTLRGQTVRTGRRDGLVHVVTTAGDLVLPEGSALITEANEGWTVEDLRPYTDHIFATFGPERVMWGSDWPVCRLRCEYGDWLASAQDIASGYSDEDQAWIFGDTAAAFYGIGPA